MNLSNKTVLVTGANGLVGMPTIKYLLEKNVKRVIAVDISMKNLFMYSSDPRVELKFKDLTYYHECQQLFEKGNIDIVLHLAGIKGSPSRTAKFPADYVFPMMMFNTNMIKAAFEAKVDWFVYMSSVGVYAPADVMYEDSVWSTMPSKNDWHPGWAKRMGELCLDALKIQYGWDNWSIVRPSNIYGLHDNFSENATVIAANVWKVFNNTQKIICWGDGSARRDFVFGDDVAKATIKLVEQEVRDVINFGSAHAVTIKETVETIVRNYNELTGINLDIEWDLTKPNGDLLRCLSADKQKHYNILPETSLSDGILQTLDFYRQRL